METRRFDGSVAPEAAAVSNRAGASPFVIICEHASNRLPDGLGTLGLPEADLTRHIAWDPGALEVATLLASVLDATLVESRVSRLVIDCNRPLDAPDLIPTISETTVIPGNHGLSEQQRAERVAMSWTPFHTALGDVVAQRLAAGRATWPVSIHSFTPVYKGAARPWPIGIIHDDDTRLAAPLIEALRADGAFPVGVNQPYSPADRVYFTLAHHARSHDLPCAMVEIRNDEIADAPTQRAWAARLARILAELKPAQEIWQTADRAAHQPGAGGDARGPRIPTSTGTGTSR